MPAPKHIKVTLIRSPIGRLKKHKACIAGLGLRKVGSTGILEDTASVRGMINKVGYLLKVEDHQDERVETRSRPGPRRRAAGHRGYIWERDGWPTLTWDETKLSPLITQRYSEVAALRARFDAIGLSENEQQSVANEISRLEQSPGEPEGVAEVMRDATQNFDSPLNKERICAWQKALFPTGCADGIDIITGDYRDDREGNMVVVSGPFGKEKTHFEAPPATAISTEMDHFFAWIQNPGDTNPALIPAIAHLWFLTVHPFDNGNGRIARAITESILASIAINPPTLYCVSSQIHEQRRNYDLKIEWTQKSELEITSWLIWFLELERAAIRQAESDITRVLRRRAYWQRYPENTLNTRQRKVIKRFLGPFKGNLTRKKWAKIARCSQDTASKDIADLLERGALKIDSDNDRNTSYQWDVDE